MDLPLVDPVLQTLEDRPCAPGAGKPGAGGCLPRTRRGGRDEVGRLATLAATAAVAVYWRASLLITGLYFLAAACSPTSRSASRFRLARLSARYRNQASTRFTWIGMAGFAESDGRLASHLELGQK